MGICDPFKHDWVLRNTASASVSQSHVLKRSARVNLFVQQRKEVYLLSYPFAVPCTGRQGRLAFISNLVRSAEAVVYAQLRLGR